MFDENFSFLSSTTSSESLPYDGYCSSGVSPFTSRNSSPRLAPVNSSSAARSTQPLPCRDSRFDFAPRHPSVAALAAQLEMHALDTAAPDLTLLDNSPTALTPLSLTMSSFSDEGFVDAPSPATPSDESDLDISFWDLSSSDLNITSTPRNSVSIDNNTLRSFALRRRQRQALVRLQCMADREPDLMVLLEECHPSSLPLKGESWKSSSKGSSTSSLSSGRIEKERSAVTKSRPRTRKRDTR